MIPLSIPNLDGNEWKYIKECLDTNWVSSVGSYVDKFEQALSDYTGAKYAVACMNGTAALHISLLLSGVEAGDYVLLPNITFIASANSIRYCNADPLLIDVDENTWQLDTNMLAQFLEEETYTKDGQLYYKKDDRRIKAIMPVHVLGNMVDMEQLCQLAETHHLRIVEDSTEALGSRYQDQHAGTFGDFGCFSFNGNKIITTGGGGMIVTDNEEMAKQAKHLTTQAKSDPMEYVHDAVGYNYRLVNILAAMGVAQMEQFPDFLKRKQAIAKFYFRELGNVGDIQFQELTPKTHSNQWLFTIKTEKQATLLQHLNTQGIQARPFWVPMNQLVMYQNVPYYQHQDISDKVYKRCLSIPCSTNISDKQLETVAQAIKSVFA